MPGTEACLPDGLPASGRAESLKWRDTGLQESGSLCIGIRVNRPDWSRA